MLNKDNKFLLMDYAKQKAAVEVIIFASNEAVTTEMLCSVFDIKFAPKKEQANQTPEANNIDNLDTENINTDGTDIPDTEELNSDEIANPEPEEMDYFELFDNIISDINHDLEKTGRPFLITKNAGGYVYSSKPEYGELLQTISKYKIKKRLSQAALETLAIIAYKQPISKSEIEQIRGVNSNEIVNSLNEKGLIEITGRKDIIGKPLLYGTTSNFLLTFGLNSIDELPKLREIEEILETEETGKSHSVTLNIEETPEAPKVEFEIPDYNEVVLNEETDNINNIHNTNNTEYNLN